MDTSPKGHYDKVLLLECNLDDMTGEALGFVLDRLITTKALDAWFTPIYMKKSRPGTMLSVLCRPEDGPALRELLLQETSTLGVRWQIYQREVAERKIDRVQTPWGAIRRKIKILAGRTISVKPEYEDCARIAREHNLTLREVTETAQHPK